MRSFFIAIATVSRFFTQDLRELLPSARKENDSRDTAPNLNYCLEGKDI